jgi:hypothetical protein
VLALVTVPAQAACLSPQPPYIPDAAASIEIFADAHQAVVTYVRDLDRYMSCVSDEAATLKPMQAKAAHDDYLAALVLMRQAVAQYNAALKAHNS